MVEFKVLNIRGVFDDFIRGNKDEIIEMLVSVFVKEIKNNKKIRDIIVDAILEHNN